MERWMDGWSFVCIMLVQRSHSGKIIANINQY